MNIKRVAGVINLIAAVIFISVGLTSQPRQNLFIIVGVVFIVIGVLRLRSTPPGPPVA